MMTAAEHYAQQYQRGMNDVLKKGIYPKDTVCIEWGTCPPTYAEVLAWGWDNPAWILVEEYGREKRRYHTTISQCEKVGCTAIVPYQPMPEPETTITLGIASTYIYTSFQAMIDDLVEQLEDDDLDLCWDERDYAQIYRQNAHLITRDALLAMVSEEETHTRLALSLMGVSDDLAYIPTLQAVWYHASDSDVWELADWALRNLSLTTYNACVLHKREWRWRFALKLLSIKAYQRPVVRVADAVPVQMALF